MAVRVTSAQVPFKPGTFESLRFVAREISEDGVITLRYALDDKIEFVEQFELPEGTQVPPETRPRIEGLLALLHWVAGVSYFKTAVPGTVRCETGIPLPATATLLRALYSEGLGEFAFTNRLPSLPRPAFPSSGTGPAPKAPQATPRRVLVPIGGGKDSVVALEIVRASRLTTIALFSVGDAPPIAATAEVAGLARLLVRRRLIAGAVRAQPTRGAQRARPDHRDRVLRRARSPPSCTGSTRSRWPTSARPRSGNVEHGRHRGEPPVQQERRVPSALLRAAVAEAPDDVDDFSVLRRASELAIARAFAATGRSTTTRSRAATRSSASTRAARRRRGAATARSAASSSSRSRRSCDARATARVFGARPAGRPGRRSPAFALLTATGGHKPFECVGEERGEHRGDPPARRRPALAQTRVVRRLVAEVLPHRPRRRRSGHGAVAQRRPRRAPPQLIADVHALLGA